MTQPKKLRAHSEPGAIQAKAVSLFDSDIHKLSRKFILAFEHDNLIRSRTAHQPRRIRFARAFAQNFHHAPHQPFTEIGRASCRERVDSSAGACSVSRQES